MFESTGLFKAIQCPLGSSCALLNCIFLHVADTSPNHPTATVEKPDEYSASLASNDEPPSKKVRVAIAVSKDSAEKDSVTASAERIKLPAEAVPEEKGGPRSSQKPPLTQGVLYTANTRVSPPPTRKLATKERQTAPKSSTLSNTTPLVMKRKHKELKSEALNPRLVPKPPTTHAVRHKLLGMIHEQFVRLDKEVEQSDEQWKDALKLSRQELITQALDEEERAAKSNVSVYANVLKLRIVALKKMNLSAWIALRFKQIAAENPGLLDRNLKPTIVETGLLAEEEIAMLPTLVTPQEGLDKYGYILKTISDKDLKDAREGVETAQGWEVCDRCSTRFQVFPGRREEDGALTSGGRCAYHWGRSQRSHGEKDLRYTCCDESLGTKGCETAESHVYKITDPKRLALVLPFAKITVTGPCSPKTAVCFDCEMGYTTLGMELIRITATAWPSGQELLDVLVRPIGEILDLNSRFSGVWHKDFTEATPYESHNEIPRDEVEGLLRVVGSPAAARELLLEHLTTTTPLIGHALENDLNAVRIIHPTIIDTVLLFPHKRGLPMRLGLKSVVKQYLNKDIQTGGALGHDSKEDARAAGELVRFKVAEKWKHMKRDGWTVSEGVFHPPPPV